MSWISWKCAADLRSHAVPSIEVITEVKPEVKMRLRCPESLRSLAGYSSEVITKAEPEAEMKLGCSEASGHMPIPEY
jgi:hypothetical protein